MKRLFLNDIPNPPRTKVFLIVALVLFFAWAVASWFGASYYVNWRANHVLADLDSRTMSTLKANQEGLERSFQLLQSIPDILSEDTDVRAVLGATQANTDKLQHSQDARRAFYESDPKARSLGEAFARYAEAIEVVSDIWILRPDGVVVASSNAGTKNSFVGLDYSFREYFKVALEGGKMLQYVVGKHSQIPGLYFSSAVHDRDGKVIGVIVCKALLSYLTNWLNQSDGILVNRYGVIIKAEHASFEMMAMENAPVLSMSEEERRTLYGRTEFPVLKISPWSEKSESHVVRVGDQDVPYHLRSSDMSNGMRLYIATEMPFLANVDYQRYLFFAGLMVMGGMLISLGTIALYRFRNLYIERWWTNRKELVDQLLSHDSLTGTYARSVADSLIQEGINLARYSQKHFAVLSLDLDDFKDVNDSFGHQAGDEVLKEVATLVHASIRESDVVIRQGGDEFLVLLQNIDDRWIAAHVSLKIQSVIREHVFNVGNETTQISVSIGIAMYPADGISPDVLLRNAETALFHAKEKQRDDYVFYQPHMSVNMAAKKAFNADMERGLKNGEFRLMYQPKCSLDDKRLTGCEALVRWIHPDKGMISPMEFIPAAEQSGFIITLGNWILHEAARQAAEWRLELGADIPIAVNLSAMQFQRTDMVNAVHSALQAHDLPACLLELELTESMIMADTSHTSEVMASLKSLGVPMAIDDFGTGYSSLAYLKKFEADVLKIDRAFVMNMENDTNDQEIVKAVISMAQGINYKVIAEGVENESQLALLREFGCHMIQGFFYSRPLSAEDFSAFWHEKAGIAAGAVQRGMPAYVSLV